MKYASEVIDLLGAHPFREFRMMEIVTFIIGAGKSRREKEAARKSVNRVLEAMEDSGSIVKAPSPYPRGGYATYRLKSSGIPAQGENVTYGILGRISHSELRDIQEQAKIKGLPNPYKAFSRHKHHAAERGIGFEMTFCEWWGLWKDSYHLRGGGPDDLCMARKGDVGPYAVGNVYLTTNRENVRDYGASQKKKKDLVELKERRKQELMSMIKEAENLPPPQYTYEQVVAMLKLGIPFELRPNVKVGHEQCAISS